MSLKTILDSWVSSLTGAGTTQDRTQSFALATDRLSATSAKQLYANSPLVKLCTDLPTEEATRAGFEVDMGNDKLTADITSRLETLQAATKLQQGLLYCRMLGGSVLYVASDDADVAQPWTPKSKVRGLHVFGVGEVTSTNEYISSIDSPNFGKPAYYKVLSMLPGASVSYPRIHHSRVIVMSGPIVDTNDRIMRQGFGVGIVEGIFAACRAYEVGTDSSSSLLTDFAAGVLTLPGVNDAMAACTEQDTNSIDVVAARLRLLDQYRSVHKSIVLDGGNGQRPPETFQRVVTPLSGLPELTDRLLQRVSMLSRIPVSVLAGVGATGLLNNGSESTQAFRAYCQAIQSTYHRPALERLIVMMLGASEPENWSVTYNPLAVPSAKETADTNVAQANADNVYFAMGAVSAEEIRESRFGKTPSYTTTLGKGPATETE